MQKLVYVYFLILSFVGPALFGQSSRISIVTTKKPGNWSDPAIWVRGQVPTLIDDVVLRHDLIIDQVSSCKSINLNSHNLTVNSGIAFDIVGNGTPESSNNNFTFYNGTAIATSQLIAIYKNVEIGVDFCLYGVWSADTINKVTSVSVRKKAFPDTTFHFILNDSLDVTHFYMDVAGIRDTSLYRVNDQEKDSLLVFYRLYTNWQNTVLLRSTHSVHIGADTSFVKSGQNLSRFSIACEGIGSKVANIALRNALRGMAGMAILGLGVTGILYGTLPAIVAAGAIFLGAQAYYHTQGNTIDHIKTTLGYILCGLPSAGADDKPPRIDDLNPNPTPPISSISPQSPLLSNCPCIFTWSVMKSTRSTGFGGTFVDNVIMSPTPSCLGETRGDSPSGILFQLGKGQSTTVVISVSYFTTCPTNPNLIGQIIYTRNFICR